MVTDFDPSMDVLILPLITDDKDGKDLTVDVDFFAEFADGSTNAWGIKFLEDSTQFAEVRIANDYITSLGFSPADRTAPLKPILEALTSSPAVINTETGFSTLAASSVLDLLPSGGFAAPSNASIPSGATVNVYGAIGGLLVANKGADASIAGTQYSDALTINDAIVDPATIRTSDLQDQASKLYGLGGGDVLYGGQLADTLYGGDGDDTLYSFIVNSNALESLSGGAGDDFLYGGASAGTFDGGDGIDTFGVVYGNLLKNVFDQGPDGMQLVVDLTQGYAAERPTSEDPNPGTAPVGANPPFDDSGQNVYKLVDIENAIGGPLNDWIRAANGSVIEGGPGADYLDLREGNVGLTYASSAEGVWVDVDPRSSTAQWGDAAGDFLANFGPFNASTVAMLTGSEHGDRLYVAGNGGTAMTGLGGADTFAASDYSPLNFDFTQPPVIITDFSQSDGDRIDLRPQGWTNVPTLSSDNVIDIVDERAGFLISYKLEGFTGTLTADDFIFAQPADGTAIGTDESDGFAGGALDDLIEGRGGDDFLHGNEGDDTLKGEEGRDLLSGGEGDDTLLGGLGNDSIRGGIGDDFIVGGDGDDWLEGDAGNDTIDAGDGADTIDGGAGDDVVLAGLGDDILVGGFGDDVLLGDLGHDTAIFAGAFGDHRITGTDSTTRIVEDLFGGGGRDTLASVELLQFDDGVLDLRTGTFDDGDADAPSDPLDDATIAMAEAEQLITAPGTVTDVEALLTPVAA